MFTMWGRLLSAAHAPASAARIVCGPLRRTQRSEITFICASHCPLSLADVAMASTPRSFAEQNYDWFLVLDFEAQCDKDRVMVPQEIIEFPTLLVNAKTFEIVSEFHQYVMPTVHKQLTPFCTELTGITQNMVDEQPELHQVLSMFNNWMFQQGLLRDGDGPSFAFVTCGAWDLKTCLPNQAAHMVIKLPTYFRNYINIKDAFKQWAGKKKTKGMLTFGMVGMLQALDLPLVGRHHSGIDDSRNIAAILRELAKRGMVF
jgi:ERI1 exoribonuclease 3